MSRRNKKQQQQVVAKPVVSNVPIKQQQAIPRQLDDILKSGVKHYGNKQYKKAKDNCIKVLNQFPSNGEAYCLLAASEYSAAPDKVNVDDILARMKKGLTFNFESTTSWHLYGIILRTEKHYVDACKTFKRLTILDKTNLAIQRELYSLQIHTGDYRSAFDTRNILLSSKTDNETNWIAKAVSAHLYGKLDIALESLNVYRKQFIKSSTPAVEQSEILVYNISLLKEKKNYKEALEMLTKNEHSIVDKIGYFERKADLELLCDEKQQAFDTYLSLLAMNPDKVDYYYGIASALGVTVTSLEDKLEQFLDICKKFSKKDDDTSSVMMLRALPMNESFKTSFKKMFDQVDSKTYYSIDAEQKYSEFTTLLGSLVTELTDSEDIKFAKLTDTQRLLKEGKTQTIEYLCVKARVLKLQGKLTEAAEAMDSARELDKADRYLANRAAKYYFRSGDIDKGLDRFKLFVRKPGKNEGPEKFDENIDDLEVVWFISEYAEALFKAGRLDEAEKAAKRVLKAYKNYLDDLFDFHSYIFTQTVKNYANSPYKLRAEEILKSIKEQRKQE
ncbi:NMDA receptor-regulated protein [Entamoeba marina]